jgi:hypothetical protein
MLLVILMLEMNSAMNRLKKRMSLTKARLHWRSWRQKRKLY